MPQKTRKFSQESVQGWSVAEVKMWLVSVKLEDCIDHFFNNSINGVRLLQLTSEDIAMMPGCQTNEKKRKQLKKALGTLPGNSVSKKPDKKSKMKSKQKGGARAEQGTPQGPRRGGGGRGELPPIPGGSLPPIPNQRPPPIPGSHPMRRGPEETYEDPSETFGIPPPLPPPPASSSVHYPGMNHPGMNHPGMDHLGMDDGGFEPDMGIDPGPGIMEDIYDAVEEMDIPGGVPLPQERGNGYPMPPPPMCAPPPVPGPPPIGDPPPPGYPPGYDEDEEQDIYDVDEGGDISDEEDVDDSFESEGGPPDLDEDDMSGPDEIYDSVPEGMLNEDPDEEGIFEDIYDIPEEELQAVRGQAGSTGKPPAAPPPAESPPPDSDEPEDFYDIPSEALEQAGVTGKPPAPPPEEPPPIDEDIYDMDEEAFPDLSPPPVQPPRPPKSSPSIDHKFTPPQLHHPMMRPPIGSPKLPPAPPPDSPPATLPNSLPPRPPKPAAEKPPPPPPIEEDLPPTSRPPPPPSTFTRPMMKAPITSGPPPPRPPTNTKFSPSSARDRNEIEAPPPPRPPSSSKPGYNKSEPQEMSIEQKLNRLQPSKAPAVIPPPPPPPVPGLAAPKPPESGPKPPGSPKPPRSPSLKPSPSISPKESPSSSPFLGGKFPQLRRVEKKPEVKKPSASPEPERKFVKPSEMKRTQASPFGSPSSTTVSNGPTVKTAKPPPPAPVVDSKPPPLFRDNKPTTSSKPAVTSKQAVTKPPPVPKTARISGLMKRFENNPGAEEQSPPPSKSPSPKHEFASPVHSSRSGFNLGPPKKVDPDVSPLSGRKFNKKESLGDLKKKFEEGSDRSVSPSSRESSRATSPDGGRPFLPPKPGGGGSGSAPTPPWVKNKIAEDKPPLVTSKPFGRAPSPHEPPPKPVVESAPAPSRPLPSWKKEPPPKPAAVTEQALPPRTSPKVGRRFPPPVAPAPPEPPAESESIEEEQSPDSNKAFVYRPYRASTKQKPPSPKAPTPEIEEEPEPPPIHRPPLQRPPISDGGAPPLPSRPPPSQPPPPSSGDVGKAPNLPSRPPPHHKPPFSPPPADVPSLPPRPHKQAPPGPPPVDSSPPLPSRPWHSQPPSVPQPAAEEPPLPSRPPKAFSAGSPSGQSWYHYSLDRKQAESKLKRYAKDGTFIVRDSTKIKGEYSLSLWFGGGIRHLRIRLRADRKFVLGEEKSDELAFDTVMDLISHHKRDPLHLRSGGETVLKYECPS